VLRDIQAALSGGAKEIVLSGVHLGSWGQDFSSPLHLRHLVQQILTSTDTPRLRLSSLEPWDLDEQFFNLWQDSRLCRHLHLPLQSGCKATLRRMARKTTPESFRKLADAARTAIPLVAITTDVIVGFPGETEGEFNESLAFVEEMEFSGGHVFTYSARPGTAAAVMPGQVPPAACKRRSAQMRATLNRAEVAYQRQFISSEVNVLWEGALSLDPQGWRMDGLTDNYLRVVSYAPMHLWNQVTAVQLQALIPDGLQGVIVDHKV
jgi:threonylcarbamoyladenosine tRNA methylthiotransferase MtaB